MRFPDNYTCYNLHNKSLKAEEDEVQTAMAQWMAYSLWLQAIPPLLLTFIYGAISDSYSRKIVMMLPVIGLLLEALIFILMTFFTQWPVEVSFA